MRGVWSDAVCAFVAGARFYEHAHRDRIAELEAENAILREVQKEPTIEDYKRAFANASNEDRRIKIGSRVDSVCTCPASSEYDDPCPHHGVLGIGVTGRN